MDYGIIGSSRYHLYMTLHVAPRAIVRNGLIGLAKVCMKHSITNSLLNEPSVHA